TTGAIAMQEAAERGLEENDWPAGDLLDKRQRSTRTRELVSVDLRPVSAATPSSRWCTPDTTRGVLAGVPRSRRRSVKAFAELGQAGRTARLRRMALLALAGYDLDVAALRPLSTHFNAIFRIDLTGGGRAVLRINRPDNRSLVDIRSELTWLDA